MAMLQDRFGSSRVAFQRFPEGILWHRERCQKARKLVDGKPEVTDIPAGFQAEAGCSRRSGQLVVGRQTMS